MITEKEFIMIHELKKQGYSIQVIAIITGKDRKTITHHLIKAAKLLVSNHSNRKPSKLFEFAAYVLEHLSKTNSRIPYVSKTNIHNITEARICKINGK